MSQVGFVYILENEYMPEVYKVGCTEHSPHERAAELSKSTGVPAPFDVLCYMEVEGFQEAEQSLHKWLNAFRISPNREFFHQGLRHAVAWMWFHPQRLSFCSIPDARAFGETILVRDEFAGMVTGADLNASCLNILPNPWDQGRQPEPPTPFDVIDTTAVDKATGSPELRVITGGSE